MVNCFIAQPGYKVNNLYLITKNPLFLHFGLEIFEILFSEDCATCAYPFPNF